MGKQLVNFITCSYESSAPFLQFTKPGANPRRIGDIGLYELLGSSIGASLKTNDWNNNEHLTVRSSTTITENAVIIMEDIRCYRSQ
jgi:hypothetical protein